MVRTSSEDVSERFENSSIRYPCGSTISKHARIPDDAGRVHNLADEMSDRLSGQNEESLKKKLEADCRDAFVLCIKYGTVTIPSRSMNGSFDVVSEYSTNSFVSAWKNTPGTL